MFHSECLGIVLWLLLAVRLPMHTGLSCCTLGCTHCACWAQRAWAACEAEVQHAGQHLGRL